MVIFSFSEIGHPEVVSVFLEEGIDLHTTRSWEFLGLEKDNQIPPDSAWNKARYGEDVIIGNLDSGNLECSCSVCLFSGFFCYINANHFYGMYY